MSPLTIPLLIAATALGAYGCWSTWKGFESENWVGAAFGLAALVAGVAAVMRQAWSRWLALMVAVLFLVSWAQAVWLAVTGGMVQAERPLVVALMLVPGLAMIAVAFACTFVVFRFFARPKAQT
jgi:hypothetical protein